MPVQSGNQSEQNRRSLQPRYVSGWNQAALPASSAPLTHCSSRNSWYAPIPWRGAGAVERGGLENRCAFAGTQGSNPCLSANNLKRTVTVQVLPDCHAGAARAFLSGTTREPPPDKGDCPPPCAPDPSPGPDTAAPPAPTSHPSKLSDQHSSYHRPRRLVPPPSACNPHNKTRHALKTPGDCQRALVNTFCWLDEYAQASV